MKRIIIYALLLFINVTVINAQEKEEALDFEASFLGDVVGNFNGGIRKGQTGIGLIHLSANLNTELANFWKGGNLFIHAHKVIGGHPSEQLIGDIQVASNIDGFTNRFIYELWYSQNIRNVTILGGLHNLNDIFHVSENASVYLNSSFGIAPSLSLNNAISIYPVTTLGGFVRWENKKISVIGGIYNFGHSFASEEGFHFANHAFRKGFYSLVEGQFRVMQGNEKKAEFKIGGTLRNCSQNHAHNTEECPAKKLYSVYILTDLNVYKTSTGRNLSMFLQTGYSESEISFSPFYIGFGANLKGVFAKNKGDEIALAYASARINQFNEGNNLFGYYKSESIVELTYKLRVHSKISIQPDIQYIINPAGVEGTSNALVGLLRTEINF